MNNIHGVDFKVEKNFHNDQWISLSCMHFRIVLFNVDNNTKLYWNAIQCSEVQCSVQIWIRYAATISFKYQPSTRLLHYKSNTFVSSWSWQFQWNISPPLFGHMSAEGYINSLCAALPLHGPNLFKFPLDFIRLHSIFGHYFHIYYWPVQISKVQSSKQSYVTDFCSIFL